MTDFEKWEQFLDDFGIGYNVETRDGQPVLIVMEQGLSNVSGYNGFFTDVSFTPDGKFLSIGAWE